MVLKKKLQYPAEWWPYVVGRVLGPVEPIFLSSEVRSGAGPRADGLVEAHHIRQTLARSARPAVEKRRSRPRHRLSRHAYSTMVQIRALRAPLLTTRRVLIYAIIHDAFPECQKLHVVDS
jgi:hypothetical protein